MSCPNCHGDAACKGFRPRNALSLLGPIRFARHYYHCAACHKGVAPLDDLLGLRADDRTPATDEVVCLAGVQDSFAQAVGVLKRLSGLGLSESSIERATEAAGERVAQAQAAGETFGPATHWRWHTDADGQTVAYVSIDATGVGQQGPRGSRAEGRMAYVGMVYNPVPEDRRRWADPKGKRPVWQARYVAGVQPLADMAEPLRKQAGQVGMDDAQRWIALSDGGTGLEDFLRENFGRVDAVILDFWHAAEYLGPLAKAAHPGDDVAAEAWRKSWCERLKAEGGRAVIAGLRAWGATQPRPAVGTALGEVLGYYENQQHRMDYPEYVGRGWQIGSGPVESACKTVIGQRMKGGGMRWGVVGSGGVAHLRAVFRSDPAHWAAFWSRNWAA
jgi:hypothetical protein